MLFIFNHVGVLQELQRLEEEDIMQECFEAMIEDELEEQINEWEKAKYVMQT